MLSRITVWKVFLFSKKSRVPFHSYRCLIFNVRRRPFFRQLKEYITFKPLCQYFFETFFKNFLKYFSGLPKASFSLLRFSLLICVPYSTILFRLCQHFLTNFFVYFALSALFRYSAPGVFVFCLAFDTIYCSRSWSGEELYLLSVTRIRPCRAGMDSELLHLHGWAEPYDTVQG